MLPVLNAKESKGVVGIKLVVELCSKCAMHAEMAPIVNAQQVAHDLTGCWGVGCMVADWLRN